MKRALVILRQRALSLANGESITLTTTRSMSVLRAIAPALTSFPHPTSDTLKPPTTTWTQLQSLQCRRSMFIQTQTTPNPTSLMFIPGKPVVGEASGRNFANAREAMASPLAKKLFLIDGISQVFFGSDFITVTKSDDYGWSVIKPDVFAAIMDFYSSGEELFYETSPDSPDAANVITEDDDEVIAMIKELLETRIRPAVQEDGGDIQFQEWDVDSGLVTLKMLGACSGCPSSAVTLKSGVENMLMHYIPEVKGVIEAEPDESEEEGLKEFKKLEQHLST